MGLIASQASAAFVTWIKEAPDWIVYVPPGAAILLVVTFFATWIVNGFREGMRMAWENEPEQVFKASHDEICYCLQAVGRSFAGYKGIPLNDYRRLAVLSSGKLKECGIPHPDLDPALYPIGVDKFSWHQFLVKLSIYSATGNLEAARLLIKSKGHFDE